MSIYVICLIMDSVVLEWDDVDIRDNMDDNVGGKSKD